MFDYNALQLRNKVITVNTVCYSIFLYRHCLDWESQSRHFQKLCLNFVLTSMSRPKILDQDGKIHRDLEILTFLGSLLWSQSRSKWIFAYFFHKNFSICQDFLSFSDSKSLNNVEISWQILTTVTKILTWQSLN